MKDSSRIIGTIIDHSEYSFAHLNFRKIQSDSTFEIWKRKTNIITNSEYVKPPFDVTVYVYYPRNKNF